MRSSVSVILSDPPPDSVMSSSDYQQTALDHQSLLVVVKQVGQHLKTRTFNRLYERISRLQRVTVTDRGQSIDPISRHVTVNGQSVDPASRHVTVRYRRSYPANNNDWGEFQTHRRVLALITIGQVACQADLDAVSSQHETLRARYRSTVLDTRCVLLGLQPDGTPARTQTPPVAPSVCEPVEITAGGDRDSGVYDHSEHGHSSLSDSSGGVTERGATTSTHGSSSGSGSDGSDVEESGRVSSETPVVRRQSEQEEVAMGIALENGVRRLEITDSDHKRSDDVPVLAGVPSAVITDSTTGVYMVTESVPGAAIVTDSLPGVAMVTDSVSGSALVTDPVPCSALVCDSTTDSVVATDSNSSVSIVTDSLPATDPVIPLVIPAALRSCALLHSSVDQCCRSIDAQIGELCSALFWVVEARRLERSAALSGTGGIRRAAMLCAPFERKDFVGLDLESRSSRRRWQGRARKHVADLSLQCGRACESLAHYQAAAELLQQSNDWLWLAACYEGSCAASVSILYPNLRQSSLHRNCSLKESRNDRHVRGSGTSSLPHGVDGASQMEQVRHCLSPSDIVNKYSEAVLHYSKYRHAGVIETECSLKAVHILIEQRRHLLAAEFLQNIVFIDLQLSDEEKILRFTTLADLYEECGFVRKAAYYRRLAAMRCVASSGNPRTGSWWRCYQLLLQALSGYRLVREPQQLLSAVESGDGWASLQIQLLQEVVGAVLRSGHTRLGVRHLTQLLHSLFWRLHQQQRTQLALQLETLVSQCPTASQPDSDSGCLQQVAVLPPQLQLCTLPVVRRFEPLPYPPHLRPQQISQSRVDHAASGPFLFSPPRPPQHTPQDGGSCCPDFLWVQGELSQVQLIVENLLAADLRVTSVCLITESGTSGTGTDDAGTGCIGTECVASMDQYPSSLSLAAHSGSHRVNLVGAPSSAGRLTVVGYAATVLGLRVVCRLAHVPWLNADRHFITVVPRLPQLQVFSSISHFSGACPFDRCGMVSAGNISLYNGETAKVVLTLKNTSASSVPVESLVLSLEPTQLSDVIEYDTSSVTSHLPLSAGSCVTFSVTVTARADFVLSTDSELLEGSSLCTSLASGTVTSDGSPFSANNTSSLSADGSRTGLGARSSTVTASGSLKVPPASQVMNAVLRVRHSGGEGMKSGYCREFGISLTVNVLPSVYITKWDVIPAESPSWCYLSLDVMNACDCELQLFMREEQQQRHLLVDGGGTCRIPLKTRRCPLVEGSEKCDSECVSSHLASSVLLSWAMYESGASGCDSAEGFSDDASCRRGSVSLAGISWQPHMLNLLRSSPIVWGVSIDGVSVDELSTVSCVDNNGAAAADTSSPCGCTVARPCRVTVSVTNCYQRPLPSAALRVRTFQQVYSAAVVPRAVLLGSPAVSVTQLEPGEELCHQVSLLCFVPGLYKLAFEFRSQSVTCSGAADVESGELGTFVANVMAVV